ncbi:hypothetical protein TcBrA4_0068760 [Trypanosoma cruzi]|nr:hypothetical protein TcBrA4_0068760 [Trypanosoma cruzi]
MDVIGGAHLNVLSEALKSATSGGRLDHRDVSIEGRSVMLFAFPRQNNVRRATSVLLLYMTDMKLISPPLDRYVLMVFLKNADNSAVQRVVNWFALNEWNAGKGRVVLAHLTEQLEEIKTALRNWDAVDKNVTTPSTSTRKEGTASDGACSTPTPTDGLVGYLSNEGERDCWVKEYVAASATMIGTGNGG